jgi:hypothetical protein
MKQQLKKYLRGNLLVWNSLLRCRRVIRRSIHKASAAVYQWRFSSIPKREFLQDLRAATLARTGYAAGKIGISQQHWMYYEIFLKKEKDPDKIDLFRNDLIFHGLKQSGVFPADPDFYLKFNEFYMPHVRNLDCLGIFYRPWELEIIKHYKLTNKVTYFQNQQVDLDGPSIEGQCYLPLFRDRKLLLVCPFAAILKERATRVIFEGVWSRAGKKKWFHPTSVDALEFPYGFSEETHGSYSDAIGLFDHITSELHKRDFDVALIGAAGLAIPIASYVKSMGKIGLDLGGHLQVLFGVLGKRHKRWGCEALNSNEWCIDMPPRYRPKEAAEVCDRGAYW